MTQLAPPKLLKIEVTLVEPVDQWGTEPYPTQPWTFRVTFNVTPQLHSYTLSTRPGIYNGLDIAVDDYIYSQSPNILKITEIISQTEDLVICYAQDLNRFNSSVDPEQTGESSIEPGQGLLFTAPYGIPVLSPLPGDLGEINSNNLIEIITRFFYTGQGVIGTGYTGSQGATGGIGYTGSHGSAGTSINIVGSVSTSSNLPGSANINDAYVTEDLNEVWVWTSSGWTNAGEIQGPPGPLGYTGSQGGTGYTGSRGLVGLTGYTGSSAVGYTGSAGSGYTGSKGDTGYIGSRGYSGSSGYTGSAGYTGSVGPAGIQGEPGEIGPEGAAGAVGYTGSQGDIGYTGSHGVPGPNTITGASDVNSTELADGSLLVYQTSQSQWRSTLVLDQQFVDGGQF